MAGNPTARDFVREAPRTKLVGGIASRVNIGRKLGYTDSQIQQLLCAELQKIRSDLLAGKLKIHN